MRFLFVHSNFPAQFVHFAPLLVQRGHQVAALGSQTARALDGVDLRRYSIQRGTTPGLFAPATRYEADCIRAAATAEKASELAREGFVPDLILGHLGWGETLFLRQIWPQAKIAVYAEFNTRPQGLDVGFDPEFGAPDLQESMRVSAKAGSVLLAMVDANYAWAPTHFQADTFPADVRSKIVVCHDGIDTDTLAPRPQARFCPPGSAHQFSAGDRVVTYVNRHMEPMRGVHSFVRALPAIFAASPDAHVVMIGAPSSRPYGLAPPEGETWLDRMLQPVRDRIDFQRLHLVGRIAKKDYCDALAVSAAHVYLTYPFVLSWSLLEAMSTGCLVIGSDTAPVREVVRHGENGVLVDFFKPDAISAAVLDGLARQDHYRTMRARARETIVQNYDLRRVCVPRLMSLLETWTGATP